MISKLRLIVLQRQVEIGRRITQEEIANETGVSRATVLRWMNSDPFGSIDADTAHKLMKWANCTLDDLLEIVEIETAL